MTKSAIPRISRDTILFVVGLAGIIYETVQNGGDQPTLLILFGGMVGLPAFLRADEAKNGKAPDSIPPGPVSPVPVPSGPPTPTGKAVDADE